jgi:hypothetical protein
VRRFIQEMIKSLIQVSIKHLNVKIIMVLFLFRKCNSLREVAGECLVYRVKMKRGESWQKIFDGYKYLEKWILKKFVNNCSEI